MTRICLPLFFLNFLWVFIAAWAFAGCSERGLLLGLVHGPLVAERGLKGARAWLLRETWGLPGSGVIPVPSALAGRFSTLEPPGEPCLPLLSCLRTKMTLLPQQQRIPHSLRAFRVRTYLRFPALWTRLFSFVRTSGSFILVC